MSRRMLLVAALALPIVAGSLEAQGELRNRPGTLQEARRAQKQEQRQELPQGVQPNRNQQLQQQIRRSLWRVAKQRIGFSDDQMLRLERTSQRFDQQRRMLAQEEKAQRVAMRTEILADSSANQSNIAIALEQLHGLQQRRLDLQAEEQKEFATFMTPLQRAKFMALQEQVRRRLQDLARARPDSTAVKLPDAP
ncbi:MAG TPA: hypothetical protein VIJ90_10965 [Gemmatimonadaceae bacterium]|jgi:hypothetical protein